MGKNPWRWNKEGYADSRAGIALQKIAREERKKAMAKKRSCRRTAGENALHEQAVRMRKMTDEQLVHYVEDRVEKAMSEGFKQGKEQAPEFKSADIEKIIGEIGDIRGVGVAKLAAIREILGKHLEVLEDV